MPEKQLQSEPESLWRCLHDGVIENIHSDLTARAVTLVVNSPFHWAFHHLPAGTRFRVVTEDVTIAEAFLFEPWPAAIEPTRDIPWSQAEEIRRENYRRGRLESISWQEFVDAVRGGDDWDILNAQITSSGSNMVLCVETLSEQSSEFREFRLHTGRLRYFVGEREMPLKAFTSFGDAYWDDFSLRAKAQERISTSPQ
jgi:hypothetical protein